jgi:Gas vesicle protein K/Gas vesicle protein
MSQEIEFEGLGSDDDLSLLETLDHVLDKGVVTAGEITISVANIDLIYLGLNVLLGSVETVNETLAQRLGPRPADAPAPRALTESAGSAEKEVDTRREGKVLLSEQSPLPPETLEPGVIRARADAPVAKLRRETERLPERINIDAQTVEQGLAKLVLTLIELIRRLLEKQAVRRMEGGGLDAAQLEELGLALMKLEEKMRELKGQFGLEDEDLNLDLGPLGRLI